LADLVRRVLDETGHEGFFDDLILDQVRELGELFSSKPIELLQTERWVIGHGREERLHCRRNILTVLVLERAEDNVLERVR